MEIFTEKRIRLPQNEALNQASQWSLWRSDSEKKEELQIIFIVELEVLGCSFTLPKGKTYNMLRGATYEEGRIQQLELDENDCAMKITNSIKEIWWWKLTE